ncbi:VOC family protein [Streptococcus mitis]|uniref:VOC family protein n=1 Tax=Streptococcus mitis TaxID=28037 RepID=UPI001CBEF421|nr:VOC family protein [Streptococcus mitis]MBZ2099205.1 VOC family protein [Streptococcus mitis]MBZ2104938.1 VOC family protein [Streptococcus mitis]MBZ2108474.1 VOC family protein [Streptococcus mitis]
MKIDHVGLYVRNLERAKNFFESYFQAQANQLYHNPKTGFSSYFLAFKDETRLEIMTRDAQLEDQGEGYLVGYHHLAISLESQEAVDKLTQQLQADGYRVVSGPRVTGDGYYESLIEILDGILIEITV